MPENKNFIEKIKMDGELLAVIIRREFNEEGRHFLTPVESPLQLGVHVRDAGTEIKPHVHKVFSKLENLPSHEVFFILEGRIQVDIFKGREKVASCILRSGDVALMMSGHSVRFLEKSRMVEIKQGPYRGVENEKEFI